MASTTRTCVHSDRGWPRMPEREAPRIWSSLSASPKSAARRSTASPSSRALLPPAGRRPSRDYIDIAPSCSPSTARPSSDSHSSHWPSPPCTRRSRRSGHVEAYPTLPEQAAVLLAQLANNAQLPDANKRAAFLLTARSLDANGLASRGPDVEIDAGMSNVAADDGGPRRDRRLDPRTYAQRRG
jgi:hypothetical protein